LYFDETLNSKSRY